MCGLAGVLRRGGVTAREAEGLQAALHHRGPDDRGVLQWDPVAGVRTGRHADDRQSRLALVHARLSVLDLTPRGWQPMSSEDGQVHLVFNGEIYNYVELREELHGLGHRFSSSSDTEVLLAAWRQWGAGCLPRLVGMWAFAVLDVAAGSLSLARDAFGIKPLYLADLPDGVAFCSELPPLLPLLGEAPQADPAGVRDYLLKGLTDHRPQTMVRGVEQLPAGTWLSIDLDGRRGPVQRWWTPPTDRHRRLDPREAAEELQRLLLRSVDLHLRSDVPVGTALSGGVDSSAIVGAVRRVGGDGVDLHAFSYVADDARIDESPWIELAARSARARRTTTRPTADELLADLDGLVRRQGEPFGSTSIYAQDRVFRAARSAGVVVLLDGQGADELFAGYPSVIASRVTSLLRAGRPLAAGRLAADAGALPGGLDARWFAARGVAALVPRSVVLAARRRLGQQVVPPWMDATWFERQGTPVDPREASTRPRDLSEALRQSFDTTSLPALLRYEDRNSMTYSLESRVPFLERDLVDFAMRLPEDLLVGDGARTKAVLKDAARGLAPDAVLDRRDKIGFETPERSWLLTLRPWVDSVLASDAAGSVPGLDLPALRAEVRDVLDGSRPFGWHVWRALNLIRWTDVFSIGHPR